MTYLSLSLWAMVFAIVAAVAAFGFNLHWAIPFFFGFLFLNVALLIAGIMTDKRNPPLL